MNLFISILFLILTLFLGFLANNTEDYICPEKIKNPFLFNIGKIISYSFIGIILGLLGFLIKINGFNGGILLLIFALDVIVVTLSHLPIFPKIVVVGLHKNHHPKNSLSSGLLNVFSSSASLHIIMIVALAHGYFLESGAMLLAFAIGSLYIPRKNEIKLKKLFYILQIILFLTAGLFTIQKGLLYSEIYIFSPFEKNKTAVVPELLNKTQFLHSNISELDKRILINSSIDLSWIIEGNKKGDTIYIPRFRHKSVLNNDYQSLSINAEKPGFIYFTSNLGKGDYIIKVLKEEIDAFNLPYKIVLDSGFKYGIHNLEPEVDMPIINITEPGIAIMSQEKQHVDITINKDGYYPNVIVLKIGVPAVINFIGKNLTEENKRIIMPYYNEYLEFAPGDNPINIPDPLIDFIFYNWKEEYGGYVLIVENPENMTKQRAQSQIRMFNSRVF